MMCISCIIKCNGSVVLLRDSNYNARDKCTALVGMSMEDWGQCISGRSNSTSMKVFSFHNKWEGRSATCVSERVDQELRGFRLYFFGLTLFSDLSGLRFSYLWLQFLEDLDEVDNYAWGAAMLAHLYSQLYRASKGIQKPSQGFGHLSR